jgi:hypothetical protein
VKWEKMRKISFMHFVALLLWMGLHKTANKADLPVVNPLAVASDCSNSQASSLWMSFNR